jgi:hypothetical protein
LVRDKKITLPFYRKWAGTNPTGATLKVEDQLFECSALLAPDHPEDGKLFWNSFQLALVLLFNSLSNPSQCRFIHNCRPETNATCDSENKLYIEI